MISLEVYLTLKKHFSLFFIVEHWLRVAKKSFSTTGGLYRLPWCRKGGKEESLGKSAAYDTESNPAISCVSSQSSALSIFGDGICMKGKPGLMDRGWFWDVLAKKKSSLFSSYKLLFNVRKQHSFLCFLHSNCASFYSFYHTLFLCCVFLFLVSERSVVPRRLCCYAYPWLHIVTGVPCVSAHVCLCMLLGYRSNSTSTSLQ